MAGRTRIGGLLVLVALVAGCAGAPDRTAQAARIQSEVEHMPGVKSFSASVTNDITSGVTLWISADMVDATEDQIAAVAARIEQLEGDDFDKYRRTVEFAVGEGLGVKREGDFDTGRVAADARGLRQLTSALPKNFETASWFRSPTFGQVELEDAQHSADILTGVRDMIGGQSTRVMIMTTAGSREPFSNSRDPLWTVQFPFTAEDQKAVFDALAALPAPADAITIEDGHIARLSVDLATSRNPQSDLESVINTVGPSTSHPLFLEWKGYTTDPNLRFEGSVDIDACTYPDSGGEDHPEKYFTPDAIALQKTLRTRFDTCHK